MYVDKQGMVSGSALYKVSVMMFNATFNNISLISWRSVLLGEGTGILGVNYQPVTSHGKTLSHTVASGTPHHQRDLNSQI
jgi:hypothetical protein